MAGHYDVIIIRSSLGWLSVSYSLFSAWFKNHVKSSAAKKKNLFIYTAGKKK
jgi:hypothetical protein